MKRILALDVLRGLAVIMVILHHMPAAKGTLLEPLYRGGWVSVDLFFVLSGFLVAGLLFKQDTVRPVQFLIRRGWKIYPPFWLLTAVTAGIYWYMFGGDFVLARIGPELTFTQSYFPDRFWGPTWSLAVEEHFYILLTILLTVISKNKFKDLPRIVLMVMTFSLVARCLNAYLRPFDPGSHLSPTHLRLDSPFFGALLAYWHLNWAGFNHFCKRYAAPLGALGIVLLSPAFLFDVEDHPAIYTIGLTGHILGSGALIMSMLCGGITENRLNRMVGFVGQHSYSIYLWHMAVIMLVAPWCGFHNDIILPLVLSVLLGVTLSYAVERPSIFLRDRLTPARA